MTLALTRGLVKAEDQETETIMSCIKDEFVDWLYSDDWRNGGAGRTCTQGVLNMKKGVHWSKSGVEGQKGCGTAMRVLPVGYLYQTDQDKLKEIAFSSGICTHNHPTSDAACIGAAYITKLLLDNTLDISEIIPAVQEFTKDMSEEWDLALNTVEELYLYYPRGEKTLEELGEGWVADEAVTLALYCFLKYRDEGYEGVVRRAANTNGDSDSIACIAGGFYGAFKGIESIPQRWVDKVQNSDYINTLSELLYDKRRSVYGR